MIEVKGLSKTFGATRGLFGKSAVPAVRRVDFSLSQGGALSFIGESGCGKTTVGRIVAGLETYDAGDITLDGESIATLDKKTRTRRMRQVQLIQQDPYQALNPAHTIETILRYPLQLVAPKEDQGPWVQKRMRELLTMVDLDPELVLHKYPHMLSGGQRQRVVVARSLTVNPTILVADEAVSMIDVSLRLGILQLLSKLRTEWGIGLLFITHDVASARYVGRDGEIAVLYKGEIVEQGPTDEIIQSPHHPYTQALLSAVPVLKGLEEPGPERFILESDLTVGDGKQGCLFAARCPFVQERCERIHPELEVLSNSRGDHRVACHFATKRDVVARIV